MDRIKVVDFIKEYEKAEVKKPCIDKHIVVDYVPFETKCAVAHDIVQKTHYVETDGKNVYHVDSISQKYRTDLWMIELYTDIDMGKGNEKLANYNLLCARGIIEGFVDALFNGDFGKFQSMIWDACNDDSGRNENIVNWLDNKFAGVGMFAEQLLTVLENISKDEKLMGKLEKMMDKVVK